MEKIGCVSGIRNSKFLNNHQTSIPTLFLLALSGNIQKLHLLINHKCPGQKVAPAKQTLHEMGWREKFWAHFSLAGISFFLMLAMFLLLLLLSLFSGLLG